MSDEARGILHIVRTTVSFSQIFLFCCLGDTALEGFLHRVVNCLAATTGVHATVAFLEGFPTSV